MLSALQPLTSIQFPFLHMIHVLLFSLQPLYLSDIYIHTTYMFVPFALQPLDLSTIDTHKRWTI